MAHPREAVFGNQSLSPALCLLASLPPLELMKRVLPPVPWVYPGYNADLALCTMPREDYPPPVRCVRSVRENAPPQHSSRSTRGSAWLVLAPAGARLGPRAERLIELGLAALYALPGSGENLHAAIAIRVTLDATPCSREVSHN